MPKLTTEQAFQAKTVSANLEGEFAGIFSAETIERVIRDSLQTMASARMAEFNPLLAERFARERLVALAKVEGKRVGTPAVLFVCVQNAGRSQMAAGWMRHLAGDAVDVYSGGSDPGNEVNAAAIEVMAEVGIDISTQYPKPWTDDIVSAADAVITMGCGDVCPVYPAKRYEDWAVSDPKGLGVEAVRPIRDDIEARVRGLLAELEVEARV